MKRHKWKAEHEMVYGTKPHVCTKCGVRKEWWGADYQSWHYSWWTTPVPAVGGGTYSEVRESFRRPECGDESMKDLKNPSF